LLILVGPIPIHDLRLAGIGKQTFLLIYSFFHGAGWFETFISNRRCQKHGPVNQHYFIFQILAEKNPFRGAWWREQRFVKIIPLEGVGTRVDWMWDEIIRIVRKKLAESEGSAEPR